MSKAVSENVALLMMFGAARATGSREQIARIKAEVLPLMHDHSVRLRDVAEKIKEVMGPDWHPVGEWRQAIDAMSQDEIQP